MRNSLDQIVSLLQQRLFVPIEASGRHVHLSKEHAQVLFGHDLTPAKPLSQPGQYAAQERVSIRGEKGQFRNVAVLGPCRRETQVEISLTDGRALGIKAPVRLSGEIDETPGCEIVGPKGSIRIDKGVIVAKRHIHMTPEDATYQNVKDGENVRLKIFSSRAVIFEDMTVRVSDKFSTSVHLDYDEANACGYCAGDLGMIVK